MGRSVVNMKPGDSLVVGQNYNGIVLVRDNNVVGDDLRFDKSTSSRGVLEKVAQRERRAAYSKYSARAEKLVGSIDPFNDHKKDLSKRSKKDLQEALAIVFEGLQYGYEKKVSPLKEENLRLRLYYLKALLEYNLNLEDSSKAVLTVNSALNEINTFKFDSKDAHPRDIDIFNNYKANIFKQREFYTAAAGVDRIVDLAQRFQDQGEKDKAVAILEEALFKRQEMVNREISFLPSIALLDKLVAISALNGDYKIAQNYIEFGVDIIKSIRKDSSIFESEENPQLEKLARTIASFYKDEDLDQAIKILDFLKKKFPNNQILRTINEDLKEKEFDPKLYLDLIDTLMAQGETDQAYDLAIKQAPRFKEFIGAVDNSAMNLWLIKAEAEFKRFKPNELVVSLATLEKKRGFAGIRSNQEPSLEDKVKRLYYAYATKNYRDSLDISRKLLEETKSGKYSQAFLREHLYWLEVRSLLSQGLKAGTALKEAIVEEFPNSERLKRLI